MYIDTEGGREKGGRGGGREPSIHDERLVCLLTIAILRRLPSAATESDSNGCLRSGTVRGPWPSDRGPAMARCTMVELFTMTISPPPLLVLAYAASRSDDVSLEALLSLSALGSRRGCPPLSLVFSAAGETATASSPTF
jgi:hypothetical protein